MKETQLLSLLKGQELTLNALFERSESFTAREKENLQNLLETLIEEGKVGKNQTVISCWKTKVISWRKSQLRIETLSF